MGQPSTSVETGSSYDMWIIAKIPLVYIMGSYLGQQVISTFSLSITCELLVRDDPVDVGRIYVHFVIC